MVHDAVDHGRGDDLVAEDVAPAGEGQVRGQDQRGVFVAAGNQLDEQVGGVLFEGDVSDFVGDEQSDAAQLGQLGWAALSRATQSTAVANVTPCPAWAALMANPIARWVLPVPGGPSSTTLRALARKAPVPRWAIMSRFNAGW